MGKKVIFGVATLFILGAALLAARGGLFAPGTPEVSTVSPEAAARAEEKLAELAANGVEARLDAGELTSLLRYRLDAWSDTPVIEPSVSIVLDTVTLSGSVAAADLPAEPELEAFRYLLPETTQVVVTGTLSTGAAGVATLRISSVEVAGMPVPPRFYPVILSRFGTQYHKPPDGIALPLPAVVSDARVEDGELVLSP
ncbi:MAG: hypothetical protein GEU90_01540 [Gemmatimonas sp.]|nr:hypothetical protein [Gemmatimonas sp.]